MTFSEFGRTIKENGTQGTDHGNLSPMMIFGDGVKGGHHGTPINLADPILNGSTVVYYESQPSTDFRKVYSGVLQDFLCLDKEITDYALGKSYTKLDLLKIHVEAILLVQTIIQFYSDIIRMKRILGRPILNFLN